MEPTNIGLHPLPSIYLTSFQSSVVLAALFVLGSSLASYSISGSIGPAVPYFTENTIHPGAVFFLGSLVGSQHRSGYR